MSERIDINPDLSIGNSLLKAVDYLWEAKTRINRLAENNGAMVTGADYSRLAQEYGCALEDAEALYNLIAGTKAEFDVVNNMYGLMTRTDQG